MSLSLPTIIQMALTDARIAELRMKIEDPVFMTNAIDDIATGISLGDILLRIQKQCACCKQFKTSDFFYRNKALKDGFNCYCKSCCKEKRDARKRRLSTT